VNLVDLLIVAAFVYAAVSGVRSGFVATLFALLTWIVAIPVALLLQGPLGAVLANIGVALPFARTVAFVLVLLLIEGGFAALGIVAISPLVKRVHADRILGPADHVLGIVPSLARTLVIAAVALAAALVLPVGPRSARSPAIRARAGHCS